MLTRIGYILSLLLSLTLAAACSDDGEAVGGDTSAVMDLKTTLADYGAVPDGVTLYKCPTPGQACNAHDPCAINPICSQDGYCRPDSWMDCDDKIECTVDKCVGAGVCSNLPKADTCKVGVKVPKGTKCSAIGSGQIKLDAGAGSGDGGPDSGAPAAMETIFCCFDSGDKNPNDPCMACSPTTDDAGVSSNNTKWSNATGGGCDDGNPCTKNDACAGGVCKGTSFLSTCSDSYACTKDLCDGKGGCLGNKLMPGWCLINAVCYKDAANDPSGKCGTCDSKTSTSAWTPITNSCLISGKCYKKGDKDTTGCAQCDPTVSTSTWTPISNMCLIKGKCYAPKAAHTGGCATCVPATSATKWTVTGTTHCLIDDKCVTSGTKHPGGCHTCTPATDKYAWTSLGGACGKCLPFNGVIGKPCTTANTATVCTNTSGLCLLTGTTGVCTEYCTPDNPSTTTNEDTCPNKPYNLCAGVPLSGGTTKYFCMRQCSPYIGCNECDSTLVCHPQSGAIIGLYGKAVCLLAKATNACKKGSDCGETTGQVCDVSKVSCPTGQTCRARSTDNTWSTVGMCAKDGVCDTVSGLCKPRPTGVATAKVGDPCKGDTDCAKGMTCNLEYNEKTFRKPGGYSCTYGSECCSGTCTSSLCTGGNCDLLWRNGYCGISNCAFSKTLTETACPAGTECNLGYATGMCQPKCSMTKASDCRGQAKDLFGDYECRDWSQVTYTHGKATSGPVCDLGPFLPCSSTSSTGLIKTCAQLGGPTNSTNMSCRDLKGTKLTNPQHASGFCLDDTASGAIPGPTDGGPAGD